MTPARGPKPPRSPARVAAVWGAVVLALAALWTALYHLYERALSTDDFPELALALAPPATVFVVAYLVQDWRAYRYRREHEAAPSEFSSAAGRVPGTEPTAPIAALGGKPEKPAGPVGRAILWAVFGLLMSVVVGGLIAVSLEEIAPHFEQTTAFKAVLSIVVIASPFVCGWLGYRAQRRKNERITSARHAPAPSSGGTAEVFVPEGDAGPNTGAAVFVPEGDAGPAQEPAVFVPDDER